MNSNIKIIICGVTEVDDHKCLGISHIIRIVNTGVDNLRPSWFKGEYLQLCFGDVVSVADAINCKTKAPDINDLNKALVFSRQAFISPESSNLVTCDYGASRSPAVALVILADYLGKGNEKEALKQVLEERPDSVPNNYVVELGDALLKRHGALRAALDELYKEITDMCVANATTAGLIGFWEENKHMKISYLDTVSGNIIFADYYHFGAQIDNCPMVIYLGGAISKEEYKSRANTEPLPILHEFETAFQQSGLTSADILILPFPPEPDETVHESLFSTLFFELLRQIPNPRPTRIACVGYSIGASFASYLTFSLIQVKALAVIGGYGMSEAINQSRMVGDASSRKYQAYWNSDSSGYMENLFLLHLLTKHEATMEIVTASGGHDFSDYASNGSVQDAFKFVLSGIAEMRGQL